uniref:Proline rich membrane anchor 1 n=1 Tax=Cairina moschata TaxID=8855 RepID=A0A8C3CGN4_CAIMO
MGLKNHCSSGGGGQGGDAIPGLRAATPLCPPLRQLPAPLPSKTFPSPLPGVRASPGLSGERRPRELPTRAGGRAAGGASRQGAGGEGRRHGSPPGAGFSRPPFPLPPRPPPSFPPSLPSRIKVGTVALRGWVRANASAAGSLCSVPRSPGARSPARPPRRDAAPGASGAAPLLLALPAAALCSPPALGLRPAPKSTFCPTEETWWPGLVIIIAVCCATLVFLFVVVIICYKAIKRKPMRKEENGTSRAEYAMTSSQNNKTVDNSAVV